MEAQRQAGWNRVDNVPYIAFGSVRAFFMRTVEKAVLFGHRKTGGRGMKEKWNEWRELFAGETGITAREFCLTVAVAFLFGMVLGIFFSPKKHVTIGSNNGSNNIVSGDDDWDDEWEEEL